MENYRWLIYAALGALAAASIAPMGKKGVEQLDSNVVTAIRSIVQALVVVAVVSFMGLWGNLKQFDGKAYGYAALTGLAGAASWLLMFKALSAPGGDAAKVMPIDKLSMPLAVLLAVIFLHEKPSGLNWTGIALMGIGAILAAWKG